MPVSRRGFILSGLAAAHAATGPKGAAFASDWRRFADDATELEVYRLTDPAYASFLPAYYNRAISRDSDWMLFWCDRTGAPQAFRMDLKNGGTRQLTDAAELDGSSLTLLPDNRAFCFFAGRTLFMSSLPNLREREIYAVPEGWEPCPGGSVGPDGTHAEFIERQGEKSRLRMAPLSRGEARTVVESAFVISEAVARPLRAQVLYRDGDAALWLVNSDGRQNHRLPLAPGRIGPANWAPDGKTLLYLSYPEDRTRLNAIREYAPDTNTDKLVAKTSQFVHFGFNRNTSVFVGASRNAASPDVLLQLRITGRELVICEHRASHPESVAPVFSPDAQRVYFQSDRTGKPAIYCMHVEKLVEKIREDAP
ncbi:MAG: oligogalacturonate lyase family protein [Acidobacteriia bacterium]|nr:oligogalacturonate lyase family protein [Terriglobia bacterium]